MNIDPIRQTINKLPPGYDYMGEDVVCAECNEDMVFGYVEHNEDSGYAGEFVCVNCGHEWSKI